MHVEAALRAVRHPRLELALEVGLHAQAGVPVLMGAAWTCTCGPTVPLYSCQPVPGVHMRPFRWSMTLERSSLRPRLAKVRFVAWVTAARAISSLYLLLVGNRSSALPQACWLQ
jgi:hypothetical protein